MNLLDYLLPFALALGLLILVHELGHYLGLDEDELDKRGLS